MKFFKVIICFFAISYSSTFSAEHFDSRIGIFRENKTFEEENPDVIFAGAPGLTYRCYIDSQLDFSMYEPQSPFQWMLDLKYDLEIAENQCNWSAKEKISKEILETIGGKYGLSELDSRDSVEDIDAVIDFMNMAALHASMAMEQVAVQRKTTELCKKHLGIEQEELQRVYAKDVIEQKADLNLDKYLEEYLEKVDITSDELKIDEQKIEHTENNIEDIRELARVLNNPNIAKKINEAAWNSYNRQTPNPENAKNIYREEVLNFVQQNFNFDFTNKPLEQLTVNYFMKLYNKTEQLLRYSDQNIKLKLRDCGSMDIYGNKDVCSYNALLELIRKEKGNEEFIAVGGMLGAEQIKNLLGEEFILGLLFKKFNFDGKVVATNEKALTTYLENCKILKQLDLTLKKLKNQIMALDEYVYICDLEIDNFALGTTVENRPGIKWKTTITLRNNRVVLCHLTDNDKEKLDNLIDRKSRFILEKEGYLNYCLKLHSELYSEYILRKKLEDDHIALLKQNQADDNILIDMFPSNDLSSRVRMQISNLIYTTNINRVIKTNPYLLSTSVKDSQIVKNIKSAINHVVPGLVKRSKNIQLQLFIGTRNLTPLHLPAFNKCEDGLDLMFASSAVSHAVMCDLYSIASAKWPIKSFFNETILNFKEEAFHNLALNCFHITTPFAAIVGQAGLNEHARLILHCEK